MTIAVLALQGAFAEHEKVLDRLSVSHIELRQAGDLKKPFDALILPGGESTVQSKLLKELDMFEPLKKRIENGMPVLATCAGLILLASEIEGQDSCHFGTIPCVCAEMPTEDSLEAFIRKKRLNLWAKFP